MPTDAAGSAVDVDIKPVVFIYYISGGRPCLL